MPGERENREILEDLVCREGTPLFGVMSMADVPPTVLKSLPEGNGMGWGISIAVRLSSSALSGIEDKPTLIYKWHYQQANAFLDRTAFLVCQTILGMGHRAVPVPASQMVDWVVPQGHLSHRSLAQRAGLGWRGRNNLLVTKEHGSQVRLVSVLTDLPLVTDDPIPFGCGSCRACASACPAKALGDRPEEYDLAKCHALLTHFSKLPGIGVQICGVCVKSCRGKP
jgi:epoxyqueuosine reductase